MRATFILMLGLVSPGANAQTYEAGQIWTYKTRPGEEASRVHIVKIEETPRGDRIFHIYVDNLKMRSLLDPNAMQTVLPHAPVSEKTLDESVIQLQGVEEELPDISEGYKFWREAYDAGAGGVFTIPVADIVDSVEQVVSGQMKPNKHE
ncbi:hypothetical protein [Pseudoxanthomonas beigongshangi]